MELMTPVQLRSALFNRLKTTQNMFDSIETTREDNIELVKIIYFKYYFDFSTAIENSITQIMSCKYTDPFSVKKMKIDDRSTSNYINSDEIKLLIDEIDDSITVNTIKNFYSGYIKIIKDGFYNSIGKDKKIEEYEKFTSYYKSSRDTRNKIAHGLLNENVKYDNTMLFKFMLSFYTIHQYHIKVYNGP